MPGPARRGSWRTIPRALFVAAATVSALVASGAWTAATAQGTGADGPVSVEVLPTEVTFQPGDVVPFDLLIENTSATPVDISTVEVLPPSRVTLAGPPPAAPGTLPPGSVARGRFELRAGLGFDSGQVIVLVQFHSAPGDAGTAHGAVELTPGKQTTEPGISFLNAPEKLNDGQSDRAVVRIVNGTPFAFEKLTLVALDGADAKLRIPGRPPKPFAGCSGAQAAVQGGRPLVCLDKLAPGETHLLDVDVVAAQSVRTGKHRVGIVLMGDRPVRSGDPIPLSTAAATADVELGVFGVDALSPFGIGTLFVLPGVLAVITFLMLSRWLYPKSQQLPDTIALSDLRAMPAVIAAAILGYLTMFLVFGHDLTQRVSTGDVVALYVIGLVFGLVVWGIMALIWQRRIGRKQFSVEDSPEKVLERLAAQEARLTLPVVAVDAAKYLFLARGREKRSLAAPQIAYNFGKDATANQRTEFRDALGADDAAKVRKLARKKVVSLKWKTADGVIPLGPDTAAVPGQVLHLLFEGSEDQAAGNSG